MICRFRFVLEVLRVQSLTYVNFRREPAVIKYKYEYPQSPLFNFSVYIFIFNKMSLLFNLFVLYLWCFCPISILSHGNNNFCMPALYTLTIHSYKREVEIKLSFQNFLSLSDQICSWVFPAQYLLEKVAIKKHTLKHFLSIVKCSNTPWIIGICFVVCKKYIHTTIIYISYVTSKLGN